MNIMSWDRSLLLLLLLPVIIGDDEEERARARERVEKKRRRCAWLRLVKHRQCIMAQQCWRVHNTNHPKCKAKKKVCVVGCMGHVPCLEGPDVDCTSCVYQLVANPNHPTVVNSQFIPTPADKASVCTHKCCVKVVAVAGGSVVTTFYNGKNQMPNTLTEAGGNVVYLLNMKTCTPQETVITNFANAKASWQDDAIYRMFVGIHAEHLGGTTALVKVLKFTGVSGGTYSTAFSSGITQYHICVDYFPGEDWEALGRLTTITRTP